MRLLLYLAERPDKSCTIGEIAAWYGVSKPHLVKVAHKLARLGYVESRQGKGGGLRLGKPAGDISIAALIKQTEPDFRIVECFDRKTNACRITTACGLKHVLHDATRAFFKTLEGYTLNSFNSRTKPSNP